MTILVVEDEPFINMNITEFLVEAGHSVVSAYNGDKAVVFLNDNANIDLLITDIDMPGSMDGVELAHKVQKEWPHIRIIVTTGKPLMKSLPSKAVFIQKPYKLDAVARAIAKLST